MKEDQPMSMRKGRAMIFFIVWVIVFILAVIFGVIFAFVFTGKKELKRIRDDSDFNVRVYSYDTENKTFTQSWQDDFGGASLDMTRWSKGNWEMELTTHSPNNVVVEDGYCKLLMTRVEK